MSDCQCTCHLNKFNHCNIEGGCGVNHRTNAGGCVTCPAIRPDKAPRQPNEPPVCDGDRHTLDRWLVEISNLHADLVNDEQPIVDQRQHERFGTVYFPDGIRHTFSRGLFPSDPLAALGGVAPINSRSKQPSVTGSRERPLPVNASTLDLKAPAKNPNLTTASVADDQIGHLSAATVLDGWVRDIRHTLFGTQHLPPATVDELATWLRNRLETICDNYPAMADFATALRNLRGALRSATGQTEPQPEPCTGIPCRRCDLLTLFRQPDGDITCLNPDCQTVMRDDEYTEWVKTLAKEQQIKRHAAA